MKHKIYNRFTLVELLIVIGIIAILMSIMLPAVGRGRSVALQTNCVSNMRQSAAALGIYADSSDGWICTYGPDYTGWFRQNGIPQTLSFVMPPASDPIRPSAYRSLTMCPSGGDDHINWYGNIAFGAPHFAFTPRDYDEVGSEIIVNDVEQYVRIYGIPSASSYVMLADSAYTKYSTEENVTPGVQCILFVRRDESSLPICAAICERHNGVANLAFGDAHISTSADKAALLSMSKIGAYTDVSGSEFIFVE